MKRVLIALWTIIVLCMSAPGQPPSAPKPQPSSTQPGTATRIGEQIDRGLTQIGAELSQAWSEVRKTVEKMGVQGRVYGRLHWDKALEGASVDVSVRDGQVVVLSGTVHSTAAKQKADELTRETVGVTSVVNELAVTSPK
jgi:osmotically-inducible protein OsmY